MSYDYVLVKGKKGAGLEALAASFGTVGAATEIRAAIDRLFPGMQWDTGNPAFWFGKGGPEFQLILRGAGQVMMLGMSRCERAEVELVAKELDLVAVDEQSLEDF